MTKQGHAADLGIIFSTTGILRIPKEWPKNHTILCFCIMKIAKCVNVGLCEKWQTFVQNVTKNSTNLPFFGRKMGLCFAKFCNFIGPLWKSQWHLYQIKGKYPLPRVLALYPFCILTWVDPILHANCPRLSPSYKNALCQSANPWSTLNDGMGSRWRVEWKGNTDYVPVWGPSPRLIPTCTS